MNYRHAYHAGSFADIVKHSVLLQLLCYLQKKPAPYCFIDTHAGEGCYDLMADSAQKTGEAAQGVGQLLLAENPPESLQQYLTLVRSNAEYPASPLLAAKMMRVQDSLILNEKHSATYLKLKQNLKSFKNVAIHQRDAYEFLPAVIPPKEKRGLVLMDPAFEDVNEMENIARCLARCYQRWPQGMYLIWLPIVGRKFYSTSDLQHAGFESHLHIEFYVQKPSVEAQGLIGCSLLVINPPWQIEVVLNPMLAYLSQQLARGFASEWKLYFT